MPDDPKPKEGEGDKGPKPAVDTEQFRSVIQEEMTKWMEAHPAGGSRQEDYPAEGQVPPSPTPAIKNPLQELVSPLVEPGLRSANIAAASAKDAAIFYATTPQAIKYKKEIEDSWNAMARTGVYLTREALFNHWKGQNMEKYLEDQKKVNDAAAAAAVHAGGVGSSTPGALPPGTPSGDPVTWTDEQLDTFLKKQQGGAVTF